MSTNNFKQFNFYDDINPDTLEHIFESAWDTLQKLYPDKKFDSCDCFSIYIIEDFIDEDDDFNDDLVFVTGLMDGKPAIQNLGYKKVEDYYFSLNNTNYCYQVAKYLEYRMFENEFPGFN